MRSKYGARRVVTEDGAFDSKREAARFQELRLMEQAGLIRNLRRQVPYEIRINGALVCKYFADAVYEELEEVISHGKPSGQVWHTVVEDTKSPATAKNPVYRLKKRLVQAVHGVVIRETE